jgi:predicted transcriptional regulator
VPTLAAYPGMMQRARKRDGLRVCRAAWLIGVSVREYRELEAGERMPSLEVYRRISELHGWPQTFAGSERSVRR